MRAELVSDSTNAASLDEVEKGILVVCLEDQSVKDPADLHKVSPFLSVFLFRVTELEDFTVWKW